MYHSIVLMNASGNARNTWDDWRLIPSAKPTFPMPEFQANYITIPGRSGSIDISNYLTGAPVYSDRNASFKFYALDTEDDWDERCENIANFVHGQRLKVFLEDDPLYYYEGRVTFADKNSAEQIPTITLSFVVGPYKKHINTGASAF